MKNGPNKEGPSSDAICGGDGTLPSQHHFVNDPASAETKCGHDGGSEERLAQVYDLIGQDAVLLPIKKGTKQPASNGWQKTTHLQTQSRSSRRRWREAAAVGVLLGKPSRNICTIDLDDDAVAEKFLGRNPKLRRSLLTKGCRGCNVWIRLIDLAPPSGPITLDGIAVGEWRADGNQTIIAGGHPNGGSYSFLNAVEPMEIGVNEIVWGSLRPPYSSESSEYSTSSVSSVSSIYAPAPPTPGPSIDAAERLHRAQAARADLDADSGLLKLYNRYIERRFIPKQGERNSATVALTTFLFRAVSVGVLRELVAAFYRVNQDVFVDSEEQHLRELEAHLAACNERWEAELSKNERQLADAMAEPIQSAFRICRDLASREGGMFFLSCNELGQRLDFSPPRAQRMLNALESLGIITMLEKGTQYKKGVRTKATSWRWNGEIPR